MVDQSIKSVVQAYLKTLCQNGIEVKCGVIYGSQARGSAGVWSDIDLVVISSRFDALRSREDIKLLWRLAARSDSRIEPTPCGERQWLEDDSSFIVEIARREGEVITL